MINTLGSPGKGECEREMEIDVDVAIAATETTGGSTQSKGGVDNRLQVVCAYGRLPSVLLLRPFGTPLIEPNSPLIRLPPP